MFPDLNFATKETNFLDSCMYKMLRVNETAVDVMVMAPSPNTTNILQIAAAWEAQGSESL